jgi:predicted amidohydrolase
MAWNPLQAGKIAAGAVDFSIHVWDINQIKSQNPESSVRFVGHTQVVEVQSSKKQTFEFFSFECFFRSQIWNLYLNLRMSHGTIITNHISVVLVTTDDLSCMYLSFL